MNTTAKFLKDVLNNWCYPHSGWLQQWLERIWLPALYLIGLINWSQFLQWGSIPLNQGDWADVTAPRLLVLKDAIQRGLLPLHIFAPTGMKEITDRFLAIPDIILSPQIILLKWLPSDTFLWINLLLLYSVGFIGLLLLRRRYRLGLAVFSLLFILYMFNGHIVDHIFIGHATWGAYFLLPFFVLLMLTMLEKQPGWAWVGQVALLALLVFLQGGFHLFVFMLIFLALTGILYPPRFRVCLAAVVFSVLACLFRILPASLIAADLKIGYLGGFTTVNEFLRGLVTLVDPSQADQVSRINPNLAWWEIDFYIGWLGLLFTAGALGLGWLKKSPGLTVFRPLLAPALVMLVLSIGRLYKFVFLLNIPMLNGERAGPRLFILPFLFGLVIAAIAAQRLIEQYPLGLPGQALLPAGFLVMFSDLQQHMELWNVNRLNDFLLPAPPLDPRLWVVANHSDPAYTGLLIVGVIISIASLVGLGILAASAKRTDAWLYNQEQEKQG